MLALLAHIVVTNSSLTHQCLQKLVAALLPPPHLTAVQQADTLEADSEVKQLQDEISSSIERVRPNSVCF